MKNQKNLPFLLMAVIAVVIFSCSQKNSTNWPGWRGENRDAKVVGFKAPTTWPAELSKIWQTKVGLGDASPSLVDGKIFLHVQIDSSEVAVCLDALTGKEVWSTELNFAPKMKGGGASHPGPRSTPEVANGKIFMLGAGGIVSCVEAASGKIIWQEKNYTEVPAFYTSFSPLVVGNQCIVHLGGHDNGVIVAFNTSDGEKLWTIEGEPSTYSSPLIMKVGSENIILLQSETNLLGLSYAGEQLFTIPTPGERRFYNSSTPVIDGDNVIIAGQGLGTKSYKIAKSGDSYSFSENWSNSDLGVSFNTPILKEGYLYAHEAGMGKLYCLNASTGETCWADTVKQDRFALALDLGKVILTLPATGEMVIYEPNHEKYVEVAKYKVAEAPVYAHPMVVGNNIFVKDKEVLTCWAVE